MARYAALGRRAAEGGSAPAWRRQHRSHRPHPRFHQTDKPDRARPHQIAFNATFDNEPVRILVCTDAVREGLDLQARCPDLIHFDLPCNPSQLEQRDGRIDRKLQPAKKVACRYFLYGQRDEDRILDALVRKTDIIRS